MMAAVCNDCKSILEDVNHIGIPRLEVLWDGECYIYKNLHFCDGFCFQRWFERHTMSDGSWQE